MKAVAVLFQAQVSRFLALAALVAWAACGPPGAVIEGEPVVWEAFRLRLQGPQAAETDSDPNPFLDFRLQVRFSSPSGRDFDVPGFYAGDGEGGAAGSEWQVYFTPDEPGDWRYQVSFRSGPEVAVSLDPSAGEATPFDGAGGVVAVAPALENAEGFLRWGRLEYVGGHYLKFRDGPYWIRGGNRQPGKPSRLRRV